VADEDMDLISVTDDPAQAVRILLSAAHRQARRPA
jgi:hypothetical protein